MKFKWLRYKNLLSSGNQWTEIALDQNKTTLIVGENGAGKSTIIEAISFALFNKAYRNINKPQLVNQITNKELVVEIEFENNQKYYKVVRGIKPNVFEIYENGSLINQEAATKDYQEYLEKQILRFNHKTFFQVVILGTANFVPFMELVAAGRRDVVEDILDLKVFSVMNSLLKNKLSKAEQDLSSNQNKREACTYKLNLLKAHMERMAENNQEIIAAKNDEIKKLSEENKATKKKWAETCATIDKMTDAFLKYQEYQGQYSEICNSIRDTDQHMKSLKEDISFYDNHSSCPTCSQKIPPKERDEKIKEAKRLLGVYTELNDSHKQELAVLTVKLNEAKKIDAELGKLRYERQMFEAEGKSTIRSINQLKAEIKLLEKQQAKTNHGDLSALEAELSTWNDQHKELANLKTTLGYASVMLKDTGIKAKIIKQYVPIINKLINKYLSILDFFCDFTLNENFEEKMLSRGRDNFSYASFSEGEKFRINLAILFTWRAIAKLRNSVNCNILFMDEVFDSSLDVHGTDEFLRMLNQLSPDNNVFIISHKVDQLVDKFDNVIRFEKRNNFSRIAT